jgi:hypothetical protein
MRDAILNNGHRGEGSAGRRLERTAIGDAQRDARCELVARKEGLQAEYTSALPSLEKAENEALAKLQAARLVLAEAQEAVDVVRAKRRATAARYDAEIATIDRELRDGADASIPAFAAEMAALWETERLTPSVSSTELIGESVKVFTDHDSRIRRLRAIRAAQLTARDEVPLEAHDAESLAARLQELRGGLPAVEIEQIAPGGC